MENMEKKQWIISLTRENPTLALVAVLLVGISATAGVSSLLWSEAAKDKVRILEENMRLRYEKDSVVRQWQVDIRECQEDLVRRLDAANAELKAQYEKYTQLNQRTDRITSQSSRMVKQNTEKIKQIDNEN